MLSAALLLLSSSKRKQVLPLLSLPDRRLTFLALCFSLSLLSCVQEEDKDADGAPVSEDCDDNDPNSTVMAEDADCDGVLTAADCDDNDPALLSSWEDPDCDGVVDCLTTTTAQEMPFVRMCGGAFDMGCTPGQSSCGGNEFPAHEVSLMYHFWMSSTEVTQAQWQALMPVNPSSFCSILIRLESLSKTLISSV